LFLKIVEIEYTMHLDDHSVIVVKLVSNYDCDEKEMIRLR